ncbi:MAG: hypothetical protein M3162_00230 [Thermoproteota archaeon]|nr:hypothetical protein [Thermoproteota archaeon]
MTHYKPNTISIGGSSAKISTDTNSIASKCSRNEACFITTITKVIDGDIVDVNEIR